MHTQVATVRGACQHLRTLSLAGCLELCPHESLPALFSQLPALALLDLSHCTQIRSEHVAAALAHSDTLVARSACQPHGDGAMAEDGVGPPTNGRRQLQPPTLRVRLAEDANPKKLPGGHRISAASSRACVYSVVQRAL
eukprot:COSAG01_NODE_2392_length_7773_cov_9.347928_10_plen_139_part_00